MHPDPITDPTSTAPLPATPPAPVTRPAPPPHPAVAAVLAVRGELLALAARRGVHDIRVLVDPADRWSAPDASVAAWVDPTVGSVIDLVVRFDLEGHEGLDLFTFAGEAEELLGRPVRVGTSHVGGELVEVAV